MVGLARIGEMMKGYGRIKNVFSSTVNTSTTKPNDDRNSICIILQTHRMAALTTP